jgi:type IV pilus assembly protein PilF
MKIKDYASAERYLLQALQLTPDLPATNANLARVYLKKAIMCAPISS